MTHGLRHMPTQQIA
ncbi:CRISPR-associated DxTHG motif protein [Streptococcus thermophilus]|nr:CRISPR-associated DxTHG motif protein [Streptococcus thermophilus]MCT2906768.1 CRISPR-associated DxTHG motif protein [Streptococcus thermophilus]MCT2913762.1 CRISPR-associated DxTHG motif protein [Streptococcus thermophilus]MCT2960962.1 CRISPR-associated DxTHG motif protein [Streptococcus thermophilus]